MYKKNSDKEKLTKHWHGEYQLQETQGNHCKNGQKKASDNNPTSSLFEIVVVNAMPKRHTDEYDQIEEDYEYCFLLYPTVHREAFSGRNGLLFNYKRTRLSLLFCLSLKNQTSNLQTVKK